MKIWRRIQKAAIAVGMIYGLWLGCNVDATDKDGASGFIMVVMAAVIGISMYTSDNKQEKSL